MNSSRFTQKVAAMILCINLFLPSVFLHAADFSASGNQSNNQAAVAADQPARTNPDLVTGSPHSQNEMNFSSGALSSPATSSLSDEERAALVLALEQATEAERLAGIEVELATEAENAATVAETAATEAVRSAIVAADDAAATASSKTTVAAIKKAVAAEKKAHTALGKADQNITKAIIALNALRDKIYDAYEKEAEKADVYYLALSIFESAKSSNDSAKSSLENAKEWEAQARKDGYAADYLAIIVEERKNAEAAVKETAAALSVATGPKNAALSQYKSAQNAIKSAEAAYDRKEDSFYKLGDIRAKKTMAWSAAIQATREAQKPLGAKQKALSDLNEAKASYLAKKQSKMDATTNKNEKIRMLSEATAARVAAQSALNG